MFLFGFIFGFIFFSILSIVNFYFYKNKTHKNKSNEFLNKINQNIELPKDIIEKEQKERDKFYLEEQLRLKLKLEEDLKDINNETLEKIIKTI